ncbi:MAG: GxxExxY protein [Bacteroidia bacterium]|nr:GxxExxY protein [Bacteroidia bacterium]
MIYEKYTKNYLDDLTYEVIGAAIEVDKVLGPGLLESAYHQCFIHELSLRRILFKTELLIPIEYKDFEFETSLRCDLYIDDIFVVELKAIECILPMHEAQLLTYMKLLKAPKGMIVNFNVLNIFKDGQKTFVNEIYRNLPDL